VQKTYVKGTYVKGGISVRRREKMLALSYLERTFLFISHSFYLCEDESDYSEWIFESAFSYFSIPTMRLD